MLLISSSLLYPTQGLWLRKKEIRKMAVELRIGLLSFTNYELSNSRYLLTRALMARNRTRRHLVFSTLPSPLPSSELVGDEVMQIFLKERQLNGDFVSRAFDKLQRRNELKFDGQETNTAEETTSQMYDNEEIDGSYLRLAATRDWISGTSDAPINKKLTMKDWKNESDKRKKLNLLKYETLKGELLFLTVGIGAVCSVYCLLNLSFEAAVSYSAGVLFSCLYLQLLYWHTDKISKHDIPEIFHIKKTKRKIGITSEDLRDNLKKLLSGTVVSLSSPRLVIPASVYGLWALSQHFHNDILNFQLVPGVMGFFAYKAAALVQAYRDNEDLLMIFPENEESDAN
ncbi:NF-kappa-B inhibitor-like protein [Rhynchospora pubera]|uniref:NF-kappa-B inhibitor-like protein n=1 Tax=Rhynchospora pubera TaxID=906938 RepID=A0AAV8DCT2_9POAL|nr:NF-kappa-B inhibitor-like protein [Rhynchospora pubera]